MVLKIETPNKKITLNEIKNFENEFNILLPEDYKDFMLKFNGGRVKDETYFFNKDKNLFNDRTEELSVNLFISLENIQKELKRIILKKQNDFFCHYWEKQFLRIAFDCDISFCLSLDKDFYGWVYCIDAVHDEEFIPMSKNFKKFMNSFHEIKPNKFESLIEKKDYKKLIKLIDEGLDPNSTLLSGKSIICELAESNQFELVKLLLEKGALTKSLVLSAALSNSFEMIDYLICLGCNVNEQSDIGSTPLMISSIRSKDILLLLLSNGADPTLKNYQGNTALTFSRRFSNLPEKYEIIKILEEAEANFSNK